MRTDWKRKLTSRKLWLSIASFASMLMIYFGYAEDKASRTASLIMAGASVIGYVIGEGLADSSPSNYIPEEEIEYIDEGEPEEAQEEEIEND